MVKLMTAPDLDAKQVEDVAQAIQRAELATLFPKHAAVVVPVDSPYWRDYWNGQAARTRMSYRQQAIAALRASKLLEQVEELEQRIALARTELEMQPVGTSQRDWFEITQRASRVLAKPLPEPDPISIKP